MPTQRPDIDPNLRRRAFAGGPTSVDIATGSFDIVISSPSPVVTWVPDPRVAPSADGECAFIEVDEVLEPGGVDLSRSHRMSFFDGHDTTSIDKILGKIENIHLEGDLLVGRATLTRKRRDLIEDIAEGFYGQISAGFSYDIRKDAEFVEREGQRPLVRVFRWLLLEASAAGLGADPRSVIRSLGQPPADVNARSSATAPPKKERNMELEELVKAAEDAVAAVIGAADEGASEEIVARANALRKLRAEAEQTDEEKAAAAAAASAEAERAEGDALTAEEEKESEQIEASARSLNKALGDHIATMRKFKAKPAALRAAALKHMEAAVPSASRSDKGGASEVEPFRPSTPPTLDVLDIYARANSRFHGRR